MARATKTRQPPTSPPDPVDTYAKAVGSGEITAGPLVRAACSRHLKDRKNGSERGLQWDSEASARAIKFFPVVLRLSEGEFSGEPFILQPWQQFIIGSLFGWKGSDGFRRFRTAYIEIGKGNGKALALDTPIPTPSGWTDMDSLRVGDSVFDERGLPCRVTAVTDVLFGRLCYNVRFSDGAEIIADASHLWRTSICGKSGTLRTTEEIAGTLNIDHYVDSDRFVVACDPVESVPVKCISVDSPSRMYLAGKHLVPTHNSPMAGGIGLYMLAADGEAGAEVYAAATMRDQARILFRDAAHMVDFSPQLTKRIQKSGIREVLNLAHLESGSFFRPVSSEGRGLDGKRVHCALIDEVHEHPSPVVVAKMRAGTKGRRQALIVEITNSGFDRNTICYQHHEHSQRVVSGLVEDDSWFAYICGLDEGEDPLESNDCWIKANPNIGVSITRKYLEEQVAEARNMPADASRVRRLNFCQWVDADNPAIPQALWRACEVDDIDETELSGLACVGGLDLSGTRDLTALARAYEPDENGVIHVIVEFWTPKETLVERSRADRVPYDQWVDEGYVVATPGRAVDYRFVAQRMSELQSEVGLERVAYDPYRIKYLETELAELAVDIKLVPHGQGYRKSQESELWMPRSLEQIESLIATGKLRVKRNPALTFAAASAVHSPDPKGNLIYDKRRSTGRIDGLVAAAMAVGSVLADGGGSVYDSESRSTGLLVL